MKSLLLLMSISCLFSQETKTEFVLPVENRIIKAGQNSYLPNTSVWILEGDLIIEKGARLTIQPGTTLKFRANTDVGRTGKDKNKSEIIVLGELIAEGEAASNKFITFTSDAPAGTQRSGDWYGIYVYKNRLAENTKLKNCNIQFAYRGITCVGSSPYIRSNQILYSFNSGIYLTSKSKARIESNVIQNNGYAGIEVRNLSEPRIYYNNITSNEYGVMVYDSSNPNLGRVAEQTATGRYKKLKRSSPNYLEGKNSIVANYAFDFYNASSKDIYAQNNSWTEAQAKNISNVIYDRANQSSYGRVIFEPLVSISTAQLQQENLKDQKVVLASNTTKKKKNVRKNNKTNKPTTKKKVVSNKPAPQKVATKKPDPVTTLKATTLAKEEDTKKQVEDVVSAPVEEVKSFTEQSKSVPLLDSSLDPETGVQKNNPRPVSTAQIRQSNLKGRVIVLITVNLEGDVVSSQVLRSAHQYLEKPALDAANKFKFSTGKYQGESVFFKKTLFFKF
jgi:TonB family protein